MKGYKESLEEMFQKETKLYQCPPKNKYGFAGASIFDFTTYDSELDFFLGNKMIEVIEAILTNTNFEYIQLSNENYINYITMVNMPFLQDKIEWGTSIHGAWFENNGDNVFYINCDIKVHQKNISRFLTELVEWCRQ